MPCSVGSGCDKGPWLADPGAKLLVPVCGGCMGSPPAPLQCPVFKGGL